MVMVTGGNMAAAAAAVAAADCWEGLEGKKWDVLLNTGIINYFGNPLSVVQFLPEHSRLTL